MCYFNYILYTGTQVVFFTAELEGHWLRIRTPETAIGNIIYHRDLIVVRVYFAECHKSKQVHFLPLYPHPSSSSLVRVLLPPFISP